MLMSNSSYVCDDVLTIFGKALRHPQISDTTDNLAIYMCTGNDSEVAFKQSNQLQSLREAVSISEFFLFKFFTDCSALFILGLQNDIN